MGILPALLPEVAKDSTPACLSEARRFKNTRFLPLHFSQHWLLLHGLQRFVVSSFRPSRGLPSGMRSLCEDLRDAVAASIPLRLVVDPDVPVQVRTDSGAASAAGELGQYMYDQFTGERMILGVFHHMFAVTQRRYPTNIRELLLAFAVTSHVTTATCAPRFHHCPARRRQA